MIKKLVRQMLTAQILSALTVSLCLLIDNIMIGQFLGEKAIAAYGLANPVLLLIGALGTMLSAGVQVVCSRSLGMGSQEETNKGYSSAIGVTLLISGFFMILVLLLHNPLATLMGAGSEGDLFDNTRNYLAGFIIGAPASMGALILVPFLQMAGRSNLLIAAVLGMTVADVVFDLLSVLVLNGGMFGMGLASSLSYYVAVLIGGTYFLSKKSVFKFSRRMISKEKILDLLKGGVPSLFSMAASVILIFVMNQLILHSEGGSLAVAAFTVITTIGNSANCISTGMNGVSLTLAGILYNEEDRHGLKDLLNTLLKHAALLGTAVGALVLLAAPLLVRIFIKEPGPAQDMAIHGLRLYAPGLIFCCMTNALKGSYQACGRPHLTEIISVAEGALLPILAGKVLGDIRGTSGLWLYFLGGELLMLILICVYVWLKTGGTPFRSDNLLLLKPEFGVEEKDLLEVNIRNMEEVINASRTAGDFCREHGQPVKTANHIALCIEEMASNTVLHGFQPGKNNALSIRVQHKDARWVLRFRDDCSSFDPVSYVPQSEDIASGMGIKLVMKMADEVRYTYSMNLNNLTVIFREQEEKKKAS
ncbi:MAG: ATP-binding protein [Lachnospiraceae bacterium]|nr:ATP-binding protein [Lachnospiraceae bacterium]